MNQAARKRINRRKQDEGVRCVAAEIARFKHALATEIDSVVAVAVRSELRRAGVETGNFDEDAHAVMEVAHELREHHVVSALWATALNGGA